MLIAEIHTSSQEEEKLNGSHWDCMVKTHERQMTVKTINYLNVSEYLVELVGCVFDFEENSHYFVKFDYVRKRMTFFLVWDL